MSNDFSKNRRNFLRRAACASVAAASAGAVFSQMRMINTALGASMACGSYPPVSDYKALVCVFLFGGNDSFNLLIPTDAQRNAVYKASRGVMAIDDPVALNVLGVPPGHTYGLHPSAQPLKSIFETQKAAFVVNTGTLLRPTVKSDYVNGTHAMPPQLFSHADQQAQWQYGQAAANGTVGWGGLSADRLQVLNVGSPLPLSISLSGQNRFQTGEVVQPYAMLSSGPTQLKGYGNNSAQKAALEDLLNQTYADPLTRTYTNTFNHAMDYYGAMSDAIAGQDLTTSFPDGNPLGDALHMIARVIKVRDTLQAKRQIFFVGLGGFDTHDDQLDLQPGLFKTVADALAAFQSAMGELQVQNQVTTFTMSEFSRTLNTDGDGTDHAWAGNQFVMGGAVKGKKLYGLPAASTPQSGDIFPDLSLNGVDCLERGQMIPATSSEQYCATLARWLGVQECDINTIFPNLQYFPVKDLGFLT